MYILNSLTLCMFIKHMCVNFEGDKKIRYNFLLINIYQGYTYRMTKRSRKKGFFSGPATKRGIGLATKAKNNFF